MKKISRNLAIVLALGFSLSSCHSSSSSSVSGDGAEAASNAAESIVSEAGAQASASEGSSSPGFTSSEYEHVAPEDNSQNFLSTCAFTTARSTCTSNVDTINWAGCGVRYATLTGGWTETWTAGFCADGTRPGALTNTNSVTRTSSGETLTLGSGAVLSLNTTAHTTYNGTSIPGTGITVTRGAVTRSIVINGLHKTMKGPFGRAWFDHSITGNLIVTGTRAAGTRSITGTSTMYHNLLNYTAAHTFNTVDWTDSTCCYPTSGTITTTYTGARTGSSTLNFAPGASTCGQADFTDTNGATSTITLSFCR